LMRLHVVKDRVVDRSMFRGPFALRPVVSLELTIADAVGGQDADWRCTTAVVAQLHAGRRTDLERHRQLCDFRRPRWHDVDRHVGGIIASAQAAGCAGGCAGGARLSSIKFGNATIQNESEIPWSANPLTITVSALSYRTQVISASVIDCLA